MRVTIFYFIIFIFTMLSSSSAQSVWEWRNPLPQGDHLFSIAYGNNHFIAMGLNGTILTSYDGVTWTEKLSGTSKNINSVAYGNNQFIAVGEDGTILSSKADAATDIIIRNLDRKFTNSLRITPVSNRLFIQMPNTFPIKYNKIRFRSGTPLLCK